MATIIKRGTRYRAQIRRKGQPTLSRSFDRRSDAKRLAEQAEARAAAGSPLRASEGEAERTTLGEALKRYRDEVAGTKKGARQIRNRIKLWLSDPLSKRFLASIRSSDIAEWRTARVYEGKAPTTIKNALQLVSQTYKLAASEWGMEGLRNPVAGVRLPPSRPGRDRRLEPGEEQRLLDACRCPTPTLLSLSASKPP